MIVCAGSGGVGKTTIAASLGVRGAQLGLRTLVLTVDPARRLATALGLDLSDDSERLVQGLMAEGTLTAAVIDSKRVFDQFILEHGRQTEVIGRIMKNRLYQQLSTTLSGSQEFTALERLLQAAESGNFDLIVLDTPPTKHAMDFLTAPQRINALFQDAVTRWFMSPGERPAAGFIANLVSRGTRVAMKSLENLTGASFIEELLEFFTAIRSVQNVLRERSERVRELLTGSQTGFLVVTSFDAAKLVEARYLQSELTKLGYMLKGVVINRAFPSVMPREPLAPPAGIEHGVYEKVLEYFKRFRDYYAVRYDLYQEFARGLESHVLVLRLPEYQRDVHGLQDLEGLAKTMGEGGMT